MKTICKICDEYIEYEINAEYRDHMKAHKLELECKKMKNGPVRGESFYCAICCQNFENIDKHLKYHQAVRKLIRMSKHWWQFWK